MFHNPRFIFWGTPQFAAIILEKLIKVDVIPQAVVCNPDRPVGRKKIITPPPVKQRIMNYESGIRDKIKILQPVHLDQEFLNSLFKIHNSFDLFIIAAYGKIIPSKILDIPKLGAIGVHPSLLPKYRGATPIQTAILNGEKETGATLFLMDEKIDHGPILVQRELTMTNDDNYDTLSKKLAELGAGLLIQFLGSPTSQKLINNVKEVELPNIELQPQNETKATYAKKFKTEDGYVDLTKDDPVMIERKVRALNPEPGVWTLRQVQGKLLRMKILEAEIKDENLILKKIQFEGKKPQTV
jgi:methionyl-tRNA formyltransferase